MTKLKTVSFLLLLSALGVPAQGQSLELKIGKAGTAGTVRFVLVHGETSLAVAAELAPMSAAEKAAALVAAVAQQAVDGNWRAQADGTRLRFQHLVADQWQDVHSVKDVSDATGSGTELATSGTQATFTLTLAEGAVANGVDAAGQPAFFTVALTDTLSWTHPLQAGETPEQVLDQLSAFLAESAGPGVGVTRSSATSLTLRFDYPQAALNWQVTDTGLVPSAGGERDAGVIEL